MEANNQILIVDADPTVQIVLAKGLKTEGYRVETATNAEQALTVLERRAFDIAVLDLNASGNTNSKELFHEIRGRWPDMITIFLAGPTSLDAAKIVLQDSAADYVLKPPELTTLVDAIRRQLDKRRSQAQLSKESEHVEGMHRESPRSANGSQANYESEFPLIKAGELVLDPLNSIAKRGSKQLPLSPNEFATLNYLVSHANRVVAPRELVRIVETDDLSEADIQTMVRAKIKRLRRKLGDDAKNPRYILNVRGKGYRFQM